MNNGSANIRETEVGSICKFITKNNRKEHKNYEKMVYCKDESGHLKIAKEIKTDFPSRKLSLYCHWAEEVWNSSFPSLLESNGMIKCEIK